MTIDEAIKTLTDSRKLPRTPHDLELNAAMELGIEARKRVKENRKTKLMVEIGLLPGETKD